MDRKIIYREFARWAQHLPDPGEADFSREAAGASPQRNQQAVAVSLWQL